MNLFEFIDLFSNFVEEEKFIIIIRKDNRIFLFDS